MINLIKKPSHFTKIILLSALIVAYFLSREISPSITLTESVDRDISTCTKNEAVDFLCLRKKFIKTLKLYSAAEVIRELEVYSSHKKLHNLQTCHGIAHLVGEIIQEEYQDINLTLEACTNACDYGCKHGAIVKHFKNNSDSENLTFFCSNQTNQQKSQKDIDSCYHAVGHAWGELYSQDFEIIAQKCTQIGSLPAHKEECIRGATMEFILGSPENPSHYTGQKTVDYVCRQLPESALKACLEYVGFLSYPIRGLDTSIAACNRIENEYKPACFYYLGSALYFDFRDDQNKLVEACKEADSNFISCINGAVEVFIGEEKYRTKARELCESLETKFQTACFAHLENRVRWATEL